VAEEFIQSLNRHGQTKFTVVRFGNVLGSNGSVVPRFAEQIRQGGPVTVTHPDIKRFFMTIPEAVQLVLQASVMGHGEDVFVLDMGEQIKVADLARNMIVLSGLVPDQDIHIVYTGLRPGEKLFEELFEETERVVPTSHSKIQRAVRAGATSFAAIEQCLMRLDLVLSDGDDETLIRWLQEAVPSYQPVTTKNAQATSLS
jgi:FlaA1/EpsC-like NDP-sugar epimerase